MLRWRLTYNQWRKAGKVNAIITTVFTVLAVLSAIGTFFVTLLAGNHLLGSLTPTHHLLLWLGIVGVLFFSWAVGLLVEVQQSELLSLENLLRLPVSLKGAFFLNYLTSWFSFTMLFFLPIILGLCISLPKVHGNMMLWVTPLAFGFLFMLTSLTYQIRGWLGRLMQNNTVVAIMTIGFVLLSQLPQLFLLSDWSGQSNRNPTHAELELEIEAAEQSGLGDSGEWIDAQYVPILTTGSAVCPLTWLPYGVRAASLGDWVAPACCSFGMFLIGGISLSMSYRGTMKAYTKSGAVNLSAVAARQTQSLQTNAATDEADKKLMVAKDVPWASPQTSAIAMTSFQSLLRAPEAKMVLIMPLVMLCVFGGMLIGRQEVMPSFLRPLTGLGILAISMFSLAQLAMNMFGLDRYGFKTYIMMPVQRWQVLLGKNLSLMPFFVGMTLIMLVLSQVMMPMSVLHLLATLILMVPSSLIFLAIGNYVSVLVPVAMMHGSMKPMQPKIGTMLLQALFITLSPLTLFPCAIAYGIEVVLSLLLGIGWLPFYLLFAIAYAVLVVWAYSRILKAQGRFFQSREQKILEIVVAQNE